MKQNEKKGFNKKIIIYIAVIIVILAIIAFIIFKFMPIKRGENIVKDISQDLIDKSNEAGNSSDLNNVIITNEGIKVNVSDKIYEEKNVKDFIIKEMSISSQSGNTTIVFTIVNNSKEAIKDKEYTIKFLTNTGKEISKVSGIIENLDVGTEQLVYLYSDNDLSNSFDYEFKF